MVTGRFVPRVLGPGWCLAEVTTRTLGWKKPIEVFDKLIAEHHVAMSD